MLTQRGNVQMEETNGTGRIEIVLDKLVYVMVARAVSFKAKLIQGHSMARQFINKRLNAIARYEV